MDDKTVVLMRGYAVRADSKSLTSQDEVVSDVCQYFRLRGTFPVEDYEGSFTWIGIDGEDQRIRVYRNLVGTGDTFYCRRGNGVLIASSLADLAEVEGVGPTVDASSVPALFLFRTVPGPRTLFSGIRRLMPGEVLTSGDQRFTLSQLKTLSSFDGERTNEATSIVRIEQSLSRVMSDLSQLEPNVANLLSGGVDSSLIQGHLNRALGSRGSQAQSVAVTVDHPRTLEDRRYAESAASVLGCTHTNVPMVGDVAAKLKRLIAITGEPPNHAQSIALGDLARTVRSLGISAGLCGEAADSLFGTDVATRLDRAERIRRLIPGALTRGLLARACGALRRRELADTIQLASFIENRSHPSHPVNTIAAWNHRPSVEACFTRDCLDNARFQRRELLGRYDVAHDNAHECHAIGLFAEGIGTASYWSAVFEHEGVMLYFPFLDSRIIRVAHNIDPASRFSLGVAKATLKKALLRHLPSEFVYRRKLAFGQPIFEWMAPGGALRSDIDAIGNHAFVSEDVLIAARANANWFLYSLLCYDLWSKRFGRQMPCGE